MSFLLAILVAAFLAVVFGLLERRRSRVADEPRCAAPPDACPSCTAAPERDRESCHARR